MATRQGSKRNARTEARWKCVLKEWEGSGESLRGFCQKRNLCESTLRRWKRRIEIWDREDREKEDCGMVAVEMEKMSWLDSGVEVVTRAGHRISISLGFDQETFQRVLLALEVESC